MIKTALQMKLQFHLNDLKIDIIWNIEGYNCLKTFKDKFSWNLIRLQNKNNRETFPFIT